MSGELLHEGRPLVVSDDRDRIGRGAWARLFAGAVVGDEASSVAERGRALARGGEVHTVRVGLGEISAEVDGAIVTISAEPVPPRVWDAVARSAKSNPPLALGVQGRAQSVHLEHVMSVDWEEPLVPRRAAIARACSSHGGGVCEHVAAVGYAIADEIDSDPSLLLRWRGCVERALEEPPAVAEPEQRVATRDDAWQAGRLPPARAPRPLPPAAVLKRLGPSGVRVGDDELENVLARAYAAFARRD